MVAEGPLSANLLLALQDFYGGQEERSLIDWDWLGDNFVEDVLPAFVGHVFLSFISVAIALAISLPIGVAVARYRRFYAPVTTITGLLFAIPSFAFFTMLLFIFGFSVGVTPAIIALVAYSLLILIRNTVTGLDSVPAETIDAAKGMGLTPRQILFRVQLPLAIPVIVAGIRVATVTVIGIATIGAYIGAGGLGNLIFDGITRDFATQVITGAVLTTILAIAADLLLLRLERLISPWSRRAGRVV